MLVVDAIAKRLGGRSVLIDVSFSCSAGEVVAITGVNGAGKTTLQQILAGILMPDRGLIELRERSLLGRASARRRVGYVPEKADPPGHLTVADLLALVAALRRTDPLPVEMRERLGVQAFGRQTIDQLSLGERRRACLAAALVGGPHLLLLDEPTNGLDRSAQQALLELLDDQRGGGAAIVVTTHDAQFRDAIADTHLVLADGELNEP